MNARRSPPILKVALGLLAAIAFFFGQAPRPSAHATFGVTLSMATAFAESVPKTGKFQIPENQGAVTDLAGVLSGTERAILTRKLQAYRERTGHEVAILLVPSLQDTPIEDVAISVFRMWGLGDAKRDDGVLVLLSTGDRRFRMETGRGAEADLPDLLVDRITQENVRPALAQNRWFDGLNAAVDGVTAALGTDGSSVPRKGAPAPELGAKQVLLFGAFAVLFVLVSIWRIRAVGLFAYLYELFYLSTILLRSGGGGGGRSSSRDSDRFGGGGGSSGGGGASSDF
jgi:uncharacterized protein